MTGQKQVSISLKEKISSARVSSYLKCIEKYPLYSILLVLDEYEKRELYEECFFIKKALDEYNNSKIKKHKNIIGPIDFPTSISDYRKPSFQKVLEKGKIIVEEKLAKEKATLIKLKLPIKK